MIKRFTNLWRGEETAYNDIVLSARGSNYSGFLRVIGCCLQFPLPVAVFDDLGYRFLNKRGSVGCEEAGDWNFRIHRSYLSLNGDSDRVFRCVQFWNLYVGSSFGKTSIF